MSNYRNKVHNHTSPSDLFIKGKITYPQLKDANGDNWTWYIQKEEAPPDKSKMSFTVYAQCDYQLKNVFPGRDGYKERIAEILLTENFRFTVKRTTFEEVFSDRLQKKIIAEYETFKQELPHKKFLKKKEELIANRFEESFNFGSLLEEIESELE